MIKTVNGRRVEYNPFHKNALKINLKRLSRSDVLVYDMKHELDGLRKIDAECEQWLKENGFKEVQNFTEWQKEQYRAWEKNDGDYYLFFEG